MRRVLTMLVLAGVAAYAVAQEKPAADPKKDVDVEVKKPAAETPPADKIKEIRAELRKRHITLPEDTSADNLTDKLHAAVAPRAVRGRNLTWGGRFAQTMTRVGRSPIFYWSIITIEAIIILWLIMTRPAPAETPPGMLPPKAF